MDRCIYHEELAKKAQANEDRSIANKEAITDQGKLLSSIHSISENVAIIALNTEINTKTLTDVVTVQRDHESRIVTEENKEGQYALSRGNKVSLMIIGSFIGFIFTILGIIAKALL